MFKIYKNMLKNFRELQDRMWTNSSSALAGAELPNWLDSWQQQTLQGMGAWAEKAVTQSLELQQEWLEQWTGRAEGKKLKPKQFTELSAEARGSMEKWLDNQNQLWEQWLKLMRTSTGLDALPALDAWDKILRESFQAQQSLLQDWSELTGLGKLSSKELGKLFDEIAKAMNNSIATQQRLWTYWLQELSSPVPASEQVAASPPAKPEAKRPSTGGMPKKSEAQPKAKPPKRATAKQAGPGDDLKRISGIGPSLEAKLHGEGIRTFDQLAKLTPEQVAHLETTVIRFPGRIQREKWIEQAKALSAEG